MYDMQSALCSMYNKVPAALRPYLATPILNKSLQEVKLFSNLNGRGSSLCLLFLQWMDITINRFIVKIPGPDIELFVFVVLWKTP
ncbi:hypothetical protein CEXT_460721 [Caerostris extrusa]|uniref:Uncharacterized protein n=1 Tax=Caerostris extrusa TaxID=172846 RepID=A0AAV4SZV2_CAEEX|nr:hypothetical protein CEXT_460721 [Caerostris extrusa]